MTSAASTPKNDEFRSLPVFCVAGIRFVHFLEMAILLPLGPAIMQALGISEVQYGGVMAAYPLGAFLSCLTSGLWSKSSSSKKALLTCFFGFGISTLLSGSFNSFALLLVFRFLSGCFGGVISSLSYAYISEIVPARKRTQAMGYLMAAISLAVMTGAPLGLAAMKATGRWNASLFLLGLFALVLLAIAGKALPETPKPTTGRADEVALAPIRDRLIAPYRMAFSSPRLGYPILAIVLLSIGQYAITPFISPHLVKDAGAGENTLNFVFITMGVLSTIGSPLIGRLADQIGKGSVIRAMLGLSLVFAAMGFSPFSASLSSTVVIVASTLLGASLVWRVLPILSQLTDLPPAEDRTAYLLVQNTSQQLAAALGTFIGGVLYSLGTGMTFSVFALTSTLSIALLFRGGSLVSISIPLPLKPRR